MTITKSKQEQRPNQKSGAIALTVLAVVLVGLQRSHPEIWYGSFKPCFECALAFVCFWAVSGAAYSAQKFDLAERLYATSLTFRAAVFWFGVMLPNAPDVLKSLGGFPLSEEQRFTIALVALVLSWPAVQSWIKVWKRRPPPA